MPRKDPLEKFAQATALITENAQTLGTLQGLHAQLYGGMFQGKSLGELLHKYGEKATYNDLARAEIDRIIRWYGELERLHQETKDPQGKSLIGSYIDLVKDYLQIFPRTFLSLIQQGRKL